MNNGGFLEILLGDLRMVRMGEMEISVFWQKAINKKLINIQIVTRFAPFL